MTRRQAEKTIAVLAAVTAVNALAHASTAAVDHRDAMLPAVVGGGL